MTYRLVIEATAEREIRAIVGWKARNASPAIAARWYSGLIRKAATLRTHPTRCPIAAENGKFPIEIRELLYGKRGNVFRIVFTIRDDTVSILFVHHGSRQELEP